LTSATVRLCHTALEHGLDIRGSRFTLTGEAKTPARLDAVRAVGANAQVFYATTEAG